MLTTLVIQDFAIIEKLLVEFKEGFTVLTGETGAGKSILVQALHLLLGGRASVEVIRTDREAAEVEGVFKLGAESRLLERLSEMELDDGDAVAIRRVVFRNGRSRAFVNDRSVTLTTLAELTRGLVDISGQHEHVELTDENTHREILDDFAGAASLRDQVRAAVIRLRAIEKEQQTLATKEKERLEREEFLSFSLGRIDEADPKPGEDQELQRERVRLKNVERLAQGLRGSLDSLYERESSAVELVGGATAQLANLLQFDPDLGTLHGRMEEMARQIEDLSRELRAVLEGLEADPARLEEIEERLAVLKRLMRAHGPDLATVIEKRARMQEELDALGALSYRMADVEKEREQALDQALVLARRLSDVRRQAAARLGRELQDNLSSLAMEGARVEVEVVSADPQQLEEWGLDQVRFLLSANPGEEVRPLARVASGGELSRILLALKAVLSGVDRVPTYVFDEVDSGIGGAVAEVIGAKLSAVSGIHQVVCITHLPQIAVWANRHYVVRKRVSGKRTISEILPLEEEERVEELARMAGGTTVSDKARGHARELLAEARKSRRRF